MLGILARCSRSTGPWRHPDFVKLWLGRTASRFGSHIGSTALSLTAVLLLRATPAQMGLLAALGSAPSLVGAPLAGTWVDRLRCRPVLIAADIGRAALLTAIPLAALLGQLRIERLYAVAALAGLLTALFEAAEGAYVPALVPREELVEGNAALAAGDSVAEIGGQAAAGVLVQWLGGPAAVLLDAASCACSALCVGLIRVPEMPAAEPARREGVWREAVAGLRAVWADPLLRALAGNAAVSAFFGNFIGALYTLYAVRTLGVPVPLVGLLVATGGVGALAGAFAAGRVARRAGPGPALIGATLVGGGMQLLNPLAGGPLPLAVSVAMLGAAQLMGDVAYAVHAVVAVSLRQAAVPGRLLGRVTASMGAIVGAAAPLGALAGGALGGAVGPRPTLLLAACGILLAALPLLLSSVRALRELPATRELWHTIM